MQENQDRLPAEGSNVGQEPPLGQEIENSVAALKSEPTPETEKGSNWRRNLAIAAVVVVVLTLVVLSIWGMATNPILTSVLRDISIIVLALVTLIIGIFLIVLVFQLQSLIALLRDEIKPILDSASETANTVRGTTAFVSDAVVTPMIHVASLASGVAQTLRTLARTGQKAGRRTSKNPGPNRE